MRALIRPAPGFALSIRDHLVARPIRIFVVLCALVLGGGAGIPVGQAIYLYTWTDADFCDDCHTHDYANEAWSRSIHGELTTCHDCHRVPIRHYPKNLWVTVLDKPRSQDDIHRPDVAGVVCEQCHSEVGADEPLTGPMPQAIRGEVAKIDHSPLHRLHLDSKTRDPGSYFGHKGDDDTAHGANEEHDGDSAPDPAERADPHGRRAAPDVGAGHQGDADEIDGHEVDGAQEPAAGGSHGGGGHGPSDPNRITCMDCHGAENNRAHRFESTSENCVRCHEAQALSGGRLEALSCRECHYSGFAEPAVVEEDGR